MRPTLSCALLLLVLLVSACQGPPATSILMEVTRVVIVTPTPDAAAAVASSDTPEPEVTPTLAPTGTVDSAEAAGATLSVATLSPSLSPEATTDPFPTPVVAQIFIAEQEFENGFMFWLQPVNQIWVAASMDFNNDGDDDDRNEMAWSVYDDTYGEGEPEIDPSLVPPPGWYQPERGFGKLWRDNPEIREALGWAIQPEFGHVTRYTYQAGGSVDENNAYTFGPGQHVIVTLNGNPFIFDEATRTWRQIR